MTKDNHRLWIASRAATGALVAPTPFRYIRAPRGPGSFAVGRLT
ncbi:MAG: hypothetical protein JWL84_439 [Rhodospirillales bacterium]|jgi:hypothetical protein|nr:hypothetical protein [Rhodospirillales bacterium]